MRYELQCWGKENLEEHLDQLSEGKIKPKVTLPWVIVSEHPDGELVEFSSNSRAKAMGYMVEHLIQESYVEWEDKVAEHFGVSDTIILQCILKYILTPEERKLLSKYYYGGL